MVWMIDKNTHVNKRGKDMDSPEHSKIGTIQDQFDRLNDEIANLREALEWYKKEAAGLSNNLTLKKMDAVEAGMVVLSLDGGNRALKALSKVE